MSCVRRRTVGLLVAVACAFSGAAFAGAASAATITVGTGQPGGAISPALMGSDYLYPFGGMGSFDSATNAFDPFFLSDLTSQVFTGSLRFPGGITADFYQWQRAIGPQAQRTENAFGPNTPPSPSTVGPDEFGQLLDQTGASGVMTTNFSTGTAQDAADEVAYMTGANGSSASANQRAANGHPAPYNVPVWEVGNEEFNAGNSWRGPDGTFVSLGGSPADVAPAATSPCAGATAGTSGLADCEYIYGGTVSFSDQAVVGFADRAPSATDSTGAANQSFFVKFPPVASDTDTVMVNGTKWTRVTSLSGVGNVDDYTIDDKTGEITFGNGTHGAIPPNGDAVTVSYHSGPHDGFNAYYAAMKAANPNIQVCATDTDQSFVADMGSTLPYDCLQYHPYESNTDTTGNIANFENTVMAAPRSEMSTAQMWQSAMQTAAGHAIPLDLSEYGSILGSTPDPSMVPYFYDSLDEALLNATQLVDWIKLGGVNVADRQLLTAEQPTAANVTNGLPDAAPFATTGAIVTPATITGADDTAVQPTGQYLQLFKPLAGGTLLGNTTANNPQLAGTTVAALIVVASQNPSSGEIDTVMVNRSPTDALPVTLNPDGATGQATMTTLNATNGGDALSTNLPGTTTPVTATVSPATVSGGSIALTIPAHSISLVQVAATPPAAAAPPAPPAAVQPAITTPTPAPTNAKRVTRVKPVKIQAIKLAGAKVTWCKRCTYAKTKLSFKLTGKAKVRVKLFKKAGGKWKQAAFVTVAGHKGKNTFLVGKRWHGRFKRGTTMQIRVQLRPAKTWLTKKTLKLTVRGH